MRQRLIYKELIIILAGGVLFFFNFESAFSQNPFQADIQLIRDKNVQFIDQANLAKKPEVDFLVASEDPLLTKINPASYVFGGLLWFYQTSLSRQFSADCLFEPTCSSFSKDAISNYGIVKGLLLTADRLCRCNRIAQSDIHPLTINEQTYRSVDGFEKYHSLKSESEYCSH